MKLKDFLKLTAEDQDIFLGVSVCGMRFEARHTARFFLNCGDCLNDKKVVAVYTHGVELHVRIED